MAGGECWHDSEIPAGKENRFPVECRGGEMLPDRRRFREIVSECYGWSPGGSSEDGFHGGPRVSDQLPARLGSCADLALP